MNRKIAISAAAVAAAAGVALGVTSLASADPSTSPSAGASASAKPKGGSHTPVTGAELTKVTNAVTAKFSGVTVTSVMKHADGSYVVHATKAGTPVRYHASADLATITEQTGGPGGKGRGGHTHTAVTGDELTKVTNAVTAKVSGVTVTSVQKDPDGSYDVVGTKAGATVHYEVSADLATVTEKTGGPAGKGGAGTAVTGAELTKVSNAVTAKFSGVSVTSVMKRPDGSYVVFGTKANAPVRYHASADLATITEKTGRPGGKGGAHTTVTGAELTKVTNAVTAKFPGVTVTSVQKDADGSYDVTGTKAGAAVAFDVSADLGTITQR